MVDCHHDVCEWMRFIIDPTTCLSEKRTERIMPGPCRHPCPAALPRPANAERSAGKRSRENSRVGLVFAFDKSTKGAFDIGRYVFFRGNIASALSVGARFFFDMELAGGCLNRLQEHGIER
jgi:hypothetical protein